MIWDMAGSGALGGGQKADAQFVATADVPAGMGFGLGMSLVIDDTKQRPGNGTFSWNGVAGTEWWYDPKNDLFMVWMIQDRNLLGEYQRKNRNWIYDALKK